MALGLTEVTVAQPKIATQCERGPWGFFFRYSAGPYEGIVYCVCVAECVDNSREQVHICTEVARDSPVVYDNT